MRGNRRRERAINSVEYHDAGIVPMMRTPRHFSPSGSILSGVVVGVVATILILATSPGPPGIQWPPANQVENNSAMFQPRGWVVVGVGPVASECSTLLVDLDSAVPANLWVVAAMHNSDVNNTTLTSAYYSSGAMPVEHVHAVVQIMDPAAGVAVAVFNPSYNESGRVSFGFVFSVPNCP